MDYPNNTRVLWFIKDFATGCRVFGGYGTVTTEGMSVRTITGNVYPLYIMDIDKISIRGDDGIIRLIDKEDVVLATKWHAKHKTSIKGSRLPSNPFS